MPKLTADELAAAHDRQDWGALWLAAAPLVVFTIEGMISKGELAPTSWANGDLRQEAQLAAGLAVRSWSPLEGAFSTWIVLRIRGAVLDALRREFKRGFGGGGETPYLVSSQEEVWIDSDPDDEADAVKQDTFVYPEDEVLVSPETAMDRAIAMRLLERCDQTDQLILRLFFGVDCEPKTISEIADFTGVSRSSAHRAVERLRRLATPG